MSSSVLLIVLQVVVFITTVLGVTAFGLWLSSGRAQLKRRLAEAIEGEYKSPTGAEEGAFHVHWEKAKNTFVLPVANWDESRLRTRLVRSGIRTENSLNILMMAKVVLATLLPAVLIVPMYLLGWFESQTILTVLWMVTSALLGFVIPDLYLSAKARERQHELEDVFPDVLDLLVVCVEAGLGLDAAIQRVSVEIERTSEVMHEELTLVMLEVRAGKSRHEALRGLADRTELSDIQSLVSILIQAENFGTSVGQALREHAEEMREVRIQRAREKAAKLPVKLTFPILLFIFPALFLVILGPALANIFIGLGGVFGN